MSQAAPGPGTRSRAPASRAARLARCPPPASSLFAAGCAPPRRAVRARPTR
ncbi:hypothetical protein [Schaalia odontolytica]|uniref:hypothetical protein n=1 Tax=Schaalia odontolytica TaxID=1660 RepID=UPI001D07C436|nr:hypothetical protein [Schaalia odontolytica]MCB6402686.1 hypothetical protein [Schaalia odontolytica]